MAKKPKLVAEEKTTIGPDANGRYYYKSKSGKGYLNFKHPLTEAELADYVEITKEEFDTLTYVAPHEPTAEEITAKEAREEVARLKKFLADTDYCVIKIAEGVATAEEYASVLTKRQAARARINELEGE